MPSSTSNPQGSNACTPSPQSTQKCLLFSRSPLVHSSPKAVQRPTLLPLLGGGGALPDASKSFLRTAAVTFGAVDSPVELNSFSEGFFALELFLRGEEGPALVSCIDMVSWFALLLSRESFVIVERVLLLFATFFFTAPFLTGSFLDRQAAPSSYLLESLPLQCRLIIGNNRACRQCQCQSLLIEVCSEFALAPNWILLPLTLIYSWLYILNLIIVEAARTILKNKSGQI